MSATSQLIAAVRRVLAESVTANEKVCSVHIDAMSALRSAIEEYDKRRAQLKSIVLKDG